MLLSESEAKAICEKLLAAVKADDALASVSSSRLAHVRFAANTITTSGQGESTTASLTVWIDRKKGSASTDELSEGSLESIVAQAEQIARVSPVDREYVPTLGPEQYQPTQGYVEATANVPPATRARAVGGVLEACVSAGLVGAGFYQASGSTQAAASRHGNFRYYRSSLASLSVTARTRQGDGSGYFLRNHFDVAKLDTARIAREAVRKALDSRNPQVLDAGVYPVILEPQAVADILGFFSFGFDARRADEGRSPFSTPGGKTKLGEKIFDERINLYSDPWHPELPGPPAAQDGIPARKFYLVRAGVLENLIYSRYWAQQKQKEPSPGPVNAILEGTGTPASLDQMIKDMKRGLLVSRFWYIRGLDPRTATLTGLTRDGIWWIEDGTIRHPVRNFRFNQSLLEMLAPGNIDQIGRPERVGGSEAQGTAAGLFPALKLKAFHLSSQSEAV